MFTKALIISTVSAVAFAGAAYAKPGEKTVRFTFQAEELSNTASVNALYNRIEETAVSACADQNNTNPIRVKMLIERCQAELVSSWVNAIDDARLNQRHAQAQNGRSYAAN